MPVSTSFQIRTSHPSSFASSFARCARPSRPCASCTPPSTPCASGSSPSATTGSKASLTLQSSPSRCLAAGIAAGGCRATRRSSSRARNPRQHAPPKLAHCPFPAHAAAVRTRSRCGRTHRARRRASLMLRGRVHASGPANVSSRAHRAAAARFSNLKMRGFQI